jgi:ribosomal protein S18 acetylase RimI-like enzyme
MTEDDVKTADLEIEAEVTAAEEAAAAEPPMWEPFKLTAVSQSRRDAVLALVQSARDAGDIPDTVPSPTENELVVQIGEPLSPLAIASLSFAQEKRMRVSCFAVHEEYRDQGLFRRVMDRVRAIADERGCRVIVVDVPSECGVAAEALESLGADPVMVRFEMAVLPEAPEA